MIGSGLNPLVTGFSGLMPLLAEHADDPTDVPVAIETTRT